MMYTGGCCDCMTRICDAEVSVEHDVAVQIERVQRRARDVLLGHVERVEQVPRVLDLVTVDDAIAEPMKMSSTSRRICVKSEGDREAVPHLAG